VWKRIEHELALHNRTPKWLATQLGWKIQRITNWKMRGVPKSTWPDIAIALGKTIDWVAGLVVTPPDHIELTQTETNLVLAFRMIVHAEQAKKADPEFVERRMTIERGGRRRHTA